MKRMNNHYGQSRLFPMSLQFFAEEGDDAGAGEGDGGGAEDGKKGNEGNPSFDDILANGHQAEFDRRLQQAINTALSNAQSKWQTLADDKISEAEKLAKMNKEEKADYLRQKKERELADKEAAITRRELMAEVKVTLAGKGVPVELAELLVFADAESCSASIEAMAKAFEDAVNQKVEERLKGGKPPKRASGMHADEGVGAAAFVDIIKENQSKR